MPNVLRQVCHCQLEAAILKLCYQPEKLTHLEIIGARKLASDFRRVCDEIYKKRGKKK